MSLIARSSRYRWLILPVALVLIVGTAAFLRAQPKRSVTTRSEEAYQSYLAGMKSLREVQTADAQRSFRRAVALDSTFAMAWMRLGRAQLGFGNLVEARNSYDKARRNFQNIKPREQYFIRMLGTDLDGDEKQRDAFMDEMLAEYPDDSEVLAYYALRAFMAGHHQKSLDAYRRLVRQDPSTGDAYNMIGYACAELGRWEEALEAFQKYAFLYPEQSNPHDSLGELYLRVGRYEDAVKACDRAVAITPSFVWARIHGACALVDEGRFDEALVRIRAGLAVTELDHPDLVNLRNQQINIHLLAGNVDSVLVLSRARIAADPIDGAPQFFLARLYAARGDIELARHWLDAYVKADVERRRLGQNRKPIEANFMIHELNGALAAGEGRWSDAADHFARSLGKTENWWINRRLQVARLESLVRAGRVPEASAYADSLARINPREPRFLGVLARLHDARGQAEEAARLRAAAGVWADSRLSIEADAEDPALLTARTAR